MDTQKSIGPTFGSELIAAGVVNIPFSWDEAGNFYYRDDVTETQISAIQAVYAAHDPTKQVTSEAPA